MGVTNFPGGINAPNVGAGWTAVPGKVFYVCNRTGAGSGNGEDPAHPLASINAALTKTVADRGDAVRVLPGHVDPITAADGWSEAKANTLVEGWGTGAQRGIVRWSAAGATVLFNVAGFVVRNLRLQMAGDPAATAALTVAAPITVSADGCAIQGCDWNVGVDADQIVTCALATAAGGTNLLIEDCRIFGDPAAEITAAGTVIRLVAADGAIIRNCHIAAALATDTDGVIETITTASKNIVVANNIIHSNGAGSTCALDFGQDLVCTGFVYGNTLVVDADGTAQTVVLTVHANNNLAGSTSRANEMVTNNNERGLVCLTATT